MHYLRAISGPDAGRRFALRPGETTIGRAGDCEVRLHDDRASRRHASLTIDPAGDVLLVDLTSANGTQVNGRTIYQSALRLGDRIGIGATALVLEEGGPDAAETRAPSPAATPGADPRGAGPAGSHPTGARAPGSAPPGPVAAAAPPRFHPAVAAATADLLGDLEACLTALRTAGPAGTPDEARRLLAQVRDRIEAFLDATPPS